MTAERLRVATESGGCRWLHQAHRQLPKQLDLHHLPPHCTRGDRDGRWCMWHHSLSPFSHRVPSAAIALGSVQLPRLRYAAHLRCALLTLPSRFNIRLETCVFVGVPHLMTRQTRFFFTHLMHQTRFFRTFDMPDMFPRMFDMFDMFFHAFNTFGAFFVRSARFSRVSYVLTILI